MKNKILQTIQENLNDVLGREDVEISNETVAPDVEGWDSLTNVRLFISLEVAFGFQFSASDIENLKSVGDIVNFISEKSI